MNQIKRFAIIKEAYAETGANPTKLCNALQIGQDLGYDRDETVGIVEYLHSRGLIVRLDPMMINIGDPKDPDEGGYVKITPKGIDEFERVLNGKESEYFPPYSLIKVHSDIINRKKSPSKIDSDDTSVMKKEMIAAVSKEPEKKWDVFISHATEDKESFVRPLAKELVRHGLKVWYDEFELSLGKDISSSINEGLANSRFGILVLSKNFFAKEWTQMELAGMYTNTVGKQKNTILPILHNMTQKELAGYSPLLAGIMNMSSSVGVEALAKVVSEIVSKAKSQKYEEGQSFPETAEVPVISQYALSKFEAELKGVFEASHNRPAILDKIEKTLFWRVIMRPLTYSQDKLTLQHCKEVVASSTVRLRGWDYPFHNESSIQYGLNFVQEGVDFRSHTALWRMYQSGQFFHEFAGIEDGEPTVPPKSMLVLATLYSFTEIYEFAKKLSEKGVFGEQIAISIEINNIRDRSLRMLDFGRELYHDYRSIEDSLPIQKTVSRKDLSENSHELALSDTVWLFERFGWTASHVPDMLRKDQEKFLKGLI